MSDPQAGQESVTFTSALQNAARLLNHAEMECDLAKMERIEEMAGRPIGIAGLLKESP